MGRKQKDSLKNILSSYGFPCFHKEEYSHSNDDNSCLLYTSFKNGEIVDKQVGAVGKPVFAEKVKKLL